MFISKEGVGDVVLYYAGGFSYHADLWAEWPSIPNSSECKRIADEFLNKIASCGYIPQQAQLEFRGVEPIEERTNRIHWCNMGDANGCGLHA